MWGFFKTWEAPFPTPAALKVEVVAAIEEAVRASPEPPEPMDVMEAICTPRDDDGKLVRPVMAGPACRSVRVETPSHTNTQHARAHTHKADRQADKLG